VIVADSEAQIEEAQIRLARVGLENMKGFLADGIDGWQAAGFAVSAVPQISVGELKNLIETQEGLQVIDVRRPAEYEGGHAPRAVTAPLAKFREMLPTLGLNPDRPSAIICAGGYRSSAATSIAQQLGFTNLLNVTGGTTAWVKAGYEVEIPSDVSTS
jgi:hydroxyacylglutathione hydrolase